PANSQSSTVDVTIHHMPGPNEWPDWRQLGITEVDEDTRRSVDVMLEDLDQRTAIQALIKARCAEDRIRDVLFRLRRVSEYDPISKDEIDRAVTALQEAFDQVLRLKH